MPSFNSLIMIGFRTFILFGFWVLLSGKKDPFYLASGFLCAGLIGTITHLGTKSPLRSGKTLRALATFPLYFFWLLGRIILAALHVSKLVLHPKMPIKPGLIEHQTKLTTDREKVLFSNSITLTPGTITADLDGDTLMIHQLDQDSAGDIMSGKMEDQIARIF